MEGSLWFIISHCLFRLMATWTIFIIQCLFCVCMFLNFCARLYCTIISGRKKYSKVVLFFTSLKFMENSHTYMKFPAYTWVCLHLLLLGAVGNCFICSIVTLSPIGHQKDELLLPTSFLQVEIKYAFIGQGRRDLQLARVSQRKQRRASYLQWEYSRVQGLSSFIYNCISFP